MTDYQFLLSLRSRAIKRPGNFSFIAIIDELILQVQTVTILERDIMLRLGLVSQLYTKLDIADLVHVGLACYWPYRIEIDRPSTITNKDRILRLNKVGFMVGNLNKWSLFHKKFRRKK